MEIAKKRPKKLAVVKNDGHLLSSAEIDTISALRNLGYRRGEAREMARRARGLVRENATASELISTALRNLGDL